MFYFIEIVTTTSGTAKAVWDKASLDEAVSAFHQTLASAMANENAVKALCLIIDDQGATYRNEYWHRQEEGV